MSHVNRNRASEIFAGGPKLRRPAGVTRCSIRDQTRHPIDDQYLDGSIPRLEFQTELLTQRGGEWRTVIVYGRPVRRSGLLAEALGKLIRRPLEHEFEPVARVGTIDDGAAD